MDSSREIVVGEDIRKDVGNNCFFVAYVVWLVWKLSQTTMLSLSEGSIVYTCIHIFVLGMLLISIFLRFQLDKAFFLAFAGAVLGMLIKHFANDITVFDLVLLLYAGHDIPFKKIAKVTFVVLAVSTVLVVVSSQLGIIQDHIFYRGSEMRHGLGFRYTTNVSHLYLSIIILYVIVRDGDVSLPEWGVILAIDTEIFILTDSRNSCGLVVVLCVLVLCSKYVRKKEFSAALAVLARLSFPLLAAMCLVFALAYNSSNPIWQRINKIESNRVAQDHASFQKYGVRAFGQEINFANRLIALGETEKTEQALDSEADTNIVESSYNNILITKGIVCYLVILLSLVIALRGVHRPWMSAIFIVIALHSAFDYQLINLMYTTPLFLVFNRVVYLLPPATSRGQITNRR
jgi:hypothetical protein